MFREDIKREKNCQKLKTEAKLCNKYIIPNIHDVCKGWIKMLREYLTVLINKVRNKLFNNRAGFLTRDLIN